MEYTTIEIDFDVHKKIEATRTSFSESPNDVLRRILAIDTKSMTSAKSPTPRGRSWRKGCVELPEGTEMRMTHNNQSYFASIIDGKWVDEFGSKHNSPSGAANSLTTTKVGDASSLNGKKYWEIRLPGSTKWELYIALEHRLKRMS